MPKGFFESFTEGFFQGGANVLNEKATQRQKLDAMRAESLMKLSVEKELYDYKKKKDLEAVTEAKKQNPYAQNAINQTAEAIMSAPPQNTAVQATKVAPAGAMPNATDEVDDSYSPFSQQTQPTAPITPVQETQPVVLSQDDQLLAPDPKPSDPANDPEARKQAALAYDATIEAGKGLSEARLEAEKVLRKYREESPTAKANEAKFKKAGELQAQREFEQSLIDEGARKEDHISRGIKYSPIVRPNTGRSISDQTEANDKDWQTFFNDKYNEGIGLTESAMPDVERSLGIAIKMPSGGINALPFVASFRRAYDPQLAEAEASSINVLAQRIQAFKPASNTDLEAVKLTTVMAQNPQKANINNALATVMLANTALEKDSFMKTYKLENISPQEAELAYREYAKDNPTFDPVAIKKGEVQPNIEKLTPEEYFKAKQTGGMEAVEALKAEKRKMAPASNEDMQQENQSVPDPLMEEMKKRGLL